MQQSPIISMFMWISLPHEIRARMREIFKIPRSSNTVVFDNHLESDGTTHEDFKSLTIEKMQEYTGSDSKDFHYLVDLTIIKINTELHPSHDEVVTTPGLDVAPQPKKKIKKNAHEKTTQE